MPYFFCFSRKNKSGRIYNPINSPASWVLYISGFIWAVILYGIVILAFGIAPQFPPAAAVLVAMFLASIPVFILPGFIEDKTWNELKSYSVVSGVISGSMVAGFIGFIGSANMDLYFKLFINIIAFVLLVILWNKIRNRVLLFNTKAR
jgi:hypothetical protein